MSKSRKHLEVLDLIKTYLKSNTDSKAKRIAKDLNLDKTEVNSVLYSNTSLFEARGDRPPLWNLRTPQRKEEPTESRADANDDATQLVEPLTAAQRNFLAAVQAEKTGELDLAIELYETSRTQLVIGGETPDSSVGLGSPGELDSASRTATPELTEDIEHLVRKYPGIYADELAALLDLSDVEVDEGIRGVRYLVLTKSDDDDEMPTPAEVEMLESIAFAGTMAFPLSTDEYDELVRKGYVKGRTSMRVTQVFGSWRRACELAGVEAPPPLRKSYERRWSDRELAEAVARYLSDPEYRGSHHRYEDWRRRNLKVDEIPSQGTLKNNLGPSWKKVQNRGLMVLREKWLSEQEAQDDD